MKVGILGLAQTKFGELWNKSLYDLLEESQYRALQDAGIEPKDIDGIFTGNMCGSIFSNQTNIASIASDILNRNISSIVVEGACASGGLALRAGILAIESGYHDIVLVNGVEKMTDIDSKDGVHGLSSALSQDWEHISGATFPGLIAMISRLYMHKYNLTRDQLSHVSVQNHSNGLLNKKAHFRKSITIDSVNNSTVIADPLTLLDCSPVSDGAASVILCSERFAKNLNKELVYIIGSGNATDSLAMSQRDNLIEWNATKVAAKRALGMAKINIEDIGVVEVHDAFSILQILGLEDLGFFEKGSAGKFIQDNLTSLNSKLPVNPSGGLKSRGHPVGATGVAQIVEIASQLYNRCGDRQINNNIKIGMTHNVGGAGANVVVHVLKRE